MSPQVVEEAEGPAAQTEEAAEPLTELKAGLTGKVIPLDDVPDDVFSQHIMGDGVAIEPENDTVVAPADAKVGVVMADSGHACGLIFANEMELLIHVGVDTVDMNGDGFELLVKEGDKVKQGQPLIRFDKEKIKSGRSSLCDSVHCYRGRTGEEYPVPYRYGGRGRKDTGYQV